MVIAAALLGVALCAGGTAPAPARTPAKATARSAAPPATLPCTRYRVLAEQNELAPDAEVAAWATAALERAGLLDPASPCLVHVRITAGALRTGGKEDGYVAHVATSTRRFLREGKLVTHEKGMLFVDAKRDEVVRRVHAFVDAFVAGLAAAPASPAPGAPARPPGG